MSKFIKKANTIHHIKSFFEISDSYENILCDIWGVLFGSSSSKCYDFIDESFKKFKDQNKNVILFSNNSNPSRLCKKTLQDKNFIFYDNINLITSGDVFIDLLKKNYPNLNRNIKIYHFGGNNLDMEFAIQHNNKLYDEIGCSYSSLNDADIVVCRNAKFDFLNQSTEHEALDIINSKKPIFVINPDVFVVTDDINRKYLSGRAGRYIESLGGVVNYCGKPSSAMYELCFDKFNLKNKEKTIAIGDSMSTDIAGANGFGIDSLLITTGVHGYSKMDIENVVSKFNIMPDYACEYLK